MKLHKREVPLYDSDILKEGRGVLDEHILNVSLYGVWGHSIIT